MNVPDDLLYTESHEWVRREGENIRVGITDHAQAELTDVVYVELPKAGRQAKAKGSRSRSWNRSKRRATSTRRHRNVVEVNKALEANPALINTDPFGEGWIFLLKIEDRTKSEKSERRCRLSCPDRLGLVQHFLDTTHQAFHVDGAGRTFVTFE